MIAFNNAVCLKLQPRRLFGARDLSLFCAEGSTDVSLSLKALRMPDYSRLTLQQTQEITML